MPRSSTRSGDSSGSGPDPPGARRTRLAWISDPGRPVDVRAIAYAVPPGAFAEGALVPETIRTPLYPLFLAACSGIAAAVFVQHVIVIAFALILFHVIARELSLAAGAAAALTFGLMPQMLVASNVVMTEAVTSVLVVGGGPAYFTNPFLLGLVPLDIMLAHSF